MMKKNGRRIDDIQQTTPLTSLLEPLRHNLCQQFALGTVLSTTSSNSFTVERYSATAFIHLGPNEQPPGNVYDIDKRGKARFSLQ